MALDGQHDAVFWGGVIVLGIWAIRSLSVQRQTGDAAMDAPRKRLADGEISPETSKRPRRHLAPEPASLLITGKAGTRRPF